MDYGTFSLSYAYAYYANGLKKSFTGPDGQQHQYTYDENNRLVSVYIDGQGYVTNAYDAGHWNSPAATSLPGGASVSFTYDPLMRVSAVTAIDPGGNTFMSRGYEYSDAGDLVAKNTEYGSHAYQYDLLDRLIEASSSSSGSTGGSSINEAYTYDADGNRLTSADRDGDWTYNGNNELLSLPGLTGSGGLQAASKFGASNRIFIEFRFQYTIL